MSTDPPKVDARVRRSTATFVRATVIPIQEGYTAQKQSPRSRAVLAQLRRGLGRDVAALPDLYPWIVNPGAPPNHSEIATPDEVAIHTALTLYALHQQSRSQPMHVVDRTFGEALGVIRYQGGDENAGVIRRFQSLGTASGVGELVHHARALIPMLRAHEVGFDYGGFAEDLAAFQDPRRADGIRLRWGRDFYRVPRPDHITRTASEDQP